MKLPGIKKSDHWPRRMSFEDYFFFYFQLWWPSCSEERNHFGNFAIGP